MERIYSKTAESEAAIALMENLQLYFVNRLNGLSQIFGGNVPFEAVEWFRDEGRHGGGMRYEGRDERLFNRASVNVSQVHYEDMPEKKLDAASAISTIIHPRNPHVPSIHMHISYTRMKDGEGYWRIMADLNPSIFYEEDQHRFIEHLNFITPDLFERGAEQGDRYFNIPALGRHRGVAHFYLEHHNSGDFGTDYGFAKYFAEQVIDVYVSIIADALAKRTEVSEEDVAEQLAYHTLYLFQVLTLDRGTTSGLLIHDQNDVGIMGSIPEFVDKALLQSWLPKMAAPQDALLQAIIDALPEADEIVLVDEAVKARLAEAVRAHYKAHPEALAMQADSAVVPPTVENHR
ncbi:coproporphyrinogen III oxidase [Sulfurimonas sp. HSL1-6]|uniref:coproporphyrinogen III oxidase n=1 Tax=Thiomicrolovo immobilis TaxID=3131935 RepID=UPI0031F88C3B